jgi:hypothetical protein
MNDDDPLFQLRVNDFGRAAQFLEDSYLFDVHYDTIWFNYERLRRYFSRFVFLQTTGNHADTEACGRQTDYSQRQGVIQKTTSGDDFIHSISQTFTELYYPENNILTFDRFVFYHFPDGLHNP